MATWTQITSRSRSMHSVQSLTESAPADGDGVDLARRYGSGVGIVTPIVRAPGGQTFTGAGYLRAYLYVPSLARWVRAPRADDDLADMAGLSEGALPPIPISWTVGRFVLVFVSCGVSGGTAPELDMLCASAAGEDI